MISALKNTPLRQQVVFTAALNVVQSLEKAPTCNRLAALDLINGCKDLEGHSPKSTSRGLDQLLDEVKSEYAARLAVCELLGAKATIPRHCNILVPTPQACIKSRYRSFLSREELPSDHVCYPDVTHAQFDRCLKSLEDKPQSWTSYSNARQNAVLMCQASRDAVEKENALSHFKNLTGVAALLTSVLADTEERSRIWLRQQLDLQEEIRRLQAQNVQGMQHEMQKISKEVQQSRHTTLSTFDDFKTAFRSFTASVARTAESISREMDETVKSNVEDALAQFQEFQSRLRLDAMDGSMEYANAHKAQLHMNMEIAKAQLQNLYDSAVHDVHSLDNHINGFRQKLQASLNEANFHAEARAAGVVTVIDGIGSKVEGLGGKVDWMESKMNASIQGVEISMNETIQRVQENFKALHSIGLLAQIITNPKYALGALSLGGTFFGTYPFCPTFARGILGLASLVVLLEVVCEKTPSYIHNHRARIIRAVWVIDNHGTTIILISWCIATVFLAIGLLYTLVYTYYFRLLSNGQRAIVLPQIEVPQYTTNRYSRSDRAASAPL